MRRALSITGLLLATSAAWLQATDAAPQGAAAVQVTTIVTRPRLLLAVDRMLYDRWYPPASIPPPPTHPDDQPVLAAAFLSADPAVRALAIRLTGRFEDARDVVTIAPFVSDRDPMLRREAMLAIAQALSKATSPETDGVVDLLFARALQERDLAAMYAAIGTIGSLKYEGAVFRRVEELLASFIRLNNERVPADIRSVVALDALEHLYQRNTGRSPTESRLALLLSMAKPLAPHLPVEAALRILHATGTATPEVMKYAARFTCVDAPKQGSQPPTPYCDGNGGASARVLGLKMMPANDPEFLSYFEEAAYESEQIDVVAEAFGKLDESGLQKVRCANLARKIAGDEPETPAIVVSKVRAIRLMSRKCSEGGELVPALKALADRLSDPLNDRRWQVPADALIKLAELDAEVAAPIVAAVAIPSAVWQVRRAAVDAAQILSDERALVGLADDVDPNVRSEAISALWRLHSPFVVPAALRALDSDDHQLVIVGAVALRDLRGEEARVAAAAGLLQALERLTREARDTSRIARLELLQRLGEFGRRDESGRSPLFDFRTSLEALLRDVDPIVAAGAATAIQEISGARPMTRPTYRPPLQPSEADLEEAVTMRASLQVQSTTTAHAILELDDGQRIGLRLRTAEAPVAVARFLNLARDGYYDGLTFYRMVDSGAVFTGSPGANDYSGDDRFWRDERASPARTIAAAMPRLFGPGAGRASDDVFQDYGVELLEHGSDAADGRLLLGPLTGTDATFTMLADLVGMAHPILEGTKIVRARTPGRPVSK